MPDEREHSSTPESAANLADGIFPSATQVEPDPVPAEKSGEPVALGDTVGTGTAIALGCVGGTLVLIVAGLIILMLVRLFG